MTKFGKEQRLNVKLRIDFGYNGTRREVTWWQQLSDFPTAVLFNGERWEWVSFEKDYSGNFDQILLFGRMSPGDARWMECVDFENRFGTSSTYDTCQCGSIHSSAPQFHMFYCPKWRKQ